MCLCTCAVPTEARRRHEIPLERELHMVVSYYVCVWVDLASGPPWPHLAHDGNGRLPGGLGHTVFHQVEHVLVIQQPDKVEGAEAGGTAQGQITDHHGAGDTGTESGYYLWN